MSSDQKKKDITIYDLAEELKISPSTVSRALNDHFSIGIDTKEAVRKLAAEMGYRPNGIASSLRTNKSKIIGILVSWINHPFLSTLIAGVEDAAKEAGYQVIIAQSHDDVAIEKQNLKALHALRVSALIVSLAMETNDYSHFEQFRKSGIPIVFVDRIPKLDNISQVIIDNFGAGYAATKHLLDQGCKRIAHFGGSRFQALYEERMLGYITALKDAGIEPDPAIIFHASFLNAEEGTRMAEAVLAMKNIPDGIFCANDTAASSALKTLVQRGVKIPDDIALIGFNNDPICEFIEPNLSSINHPAKEMGQTAVMKVLELLNVDANLGEVKPLETYVVERASSMRRRTIK